MGADPPEESPDEAAFQPEDLDFTDDERVAELQEGRYVVSTGQGAPDPPETAVDAEAGTDAGAEAGAGSEPHPNAGAGAGSDAGTAGTSDSDSGTGGTDLGQPSAAVARQRLATHLLEAEERHGFAAAAAVDGTVSQQEAFSDDIAEVFRSFLLWYATTVDETTPTDEVVGILLVAADVPVRFPEETLAELVADLGLDRGDSVGDLLDAVGEDGGLRLPRGPPRPTDRNQD